MQNKHLIILFLFLGLTQNKGAAQINLVPNPSFETLTSCPVPLLDNQIFLATPWFSASKGTPDVFNTCASNKDFGVPYNRSFCYQPSRTGAGYAGILVYSHDTNGSTRENLEVPLLQSMKKDHQYYIRFFVSTSNSSINDAPCFCDGIGAAFTNSKYLNNTTGLPVLADLQPAIDNGGNILRDTVNWIPVSGCFTNKEEEKNYMIIGNFRDDAHTLASPECDLSFPNSSYLYIEDVGVWEFDPLPDTLLLCKGDSKQFNASFLAASYTWSDGTTDSTFNISSAGVYSVSADMGDCILSDTVVVIMMKEQPLVPTDTLICQGDKTILLAPVPGDYEWSTGSKSSSIEVVESGTYVLTVVNECGVFTYENFVETEVCDCPIYVPNIFSPDGDGQNDEFSVFAACDFPLQIKQFQVFDRWGSLVYASAGGGIENIQWDGLSQGNPVTSGVYTWVMEYNIAPKGHSAQKTLQGDLTILR